MFKRREFDLCDSTGHLINNDDPIPNVILVRGGVPDTSPDVIQVQLPNGNRVQVGCSRGQNHLQFLQSVSTHVGLPTTDFVLVDENDASWIYPFDTETTTNVRAYVLRDPLRGGMMRNWFQIQDSVSHTSVSLKDSS